MSYQALISRINELPRIESVLQELLEMVNREQIDFGELAKKMAMDQVLLARVLRMANSAQFGGVKGVSNINDAIVRIGVGAIRNLISSSILSCLVHISNCPLPKVNVTSHSIFVHFLL